MEMRYFVQVNIVFYTYFTHPMAKLVFVTVILMR